MSDSGLSRLPLSGLTLGIDLGSSSLGTALVDPSAERIEFLGVRIFPAGVEGNIDEGKEDSHAAKRRLARLARRQTQRRQRRLYKVFHLLQRFGLLPAGLRVEVLETLRRELEARYPETTILPWFLRARVSIVPWNRMNLAVPSTIWPRGEASSQAAVAIGAIDAERAIQGQGFH